MNARPIGTAALILALGAEQAIFGEQGSPALASFLSSHSNAVIFINSTKTCSNGLTGGPFEGTGFVISANGHVLTAAHVIDGVDRGSSYTPRPPDCNGERYRYLGTLGTSEGDPREMKLLAVDEKRDLALLQFVGTSKYSHFELASGQGLATTEQIGAFGFPVGSAAIVPALGRITDRTRSDGRWLVDAPVNPGHSGGPVVRRDGKVVGVVDAGMQGVSLMNLITPLAQNDPFLAVTNAKQDVSPWNAKANRAVPPLSGIGDIPREGSCEERRPALEQTEKGIHWACAETMVPNGVKASVQITNPVRVVVPDSSAILEVRYFHRSRGDWQNPVEVGPWHTNPPSTDLQWMSMEQATVSRNGDGDLVVEAVCRNWSAEMRMFCGIGVRYRADAFLW